MSKMSNAILQILRKSEGHMTADQVLAQCQAQGISASVASVYRNLGVLVDQGLISRINIAGMPDYFDKTPTIHSHAVCTECGKVTDAHVGDLTALLQERTGLNITQYYLQICYICEDCSK